VAEFEFPIQEPYALEATLFSGQAFRWRPWRGAFWGVVAGEPVSVRADGDRIVVEARNGTRIGEGMRSYLRLSDPMGSIYRSIAKDDTMVGAVGRWRGLHLLAQDPWETTASFIMSSASNIPRISRTVEALCGRFGHKLGVDGWQTRAFPTASAIARAPNRELLACGLGYRAAYLKATAKAVHQGAVDLDSLRTVPTARAREVLVETLDGVGPKVADCILLFSLGKDDAFPVDRWVRRRVAEVYFDGRTLPPTRVSKWGREYFGKWAGYAQQYLFQDGRKVRVAKPA
jgi:N-glycosylase/DNA lyase